MFGTCCGRVRFPLMVGVAMLATCGLALVAQDRPRGGPPRSGPGGPPGPAPVRGNLVGMAPNGIIVKDGERQGVITIDRTTEVIIRSEGDMSALVTGATVLANGTLETPQGPLVANSITVIRSLSRTVNTTQQPSLKVNPGKKEDRTGPTATLRGTVVSATPLVVSTGGQRVAVRLGDRARIMVETSGADLRTCSEGDEVNVNFQAQTRKDTLVAQRITINRAAGGTGVAAKNAKGKGEKGKTAEKVDAKKKDAKSADAAGDAKKKPEAGAEDKAKTAKESDAKKQAK